MYRKNFARAYKALKELTFPKSIEDFENADKSAIQSYAAWGHPISG